MVQTDEQRKAKNRETQRKYRADPKNKKKIKERQRKYRENNQDKINARQKKYRADPKNKTKEKRENYLSIPEVKERTKFVTSNRNRRYVIKNRVSINEKNKQRFNQLDENQKKEKYSIRNNTRNKTTLDSRNSLI